MLNYTKAGQTSNLKVTETGTTSWTATAVSPGVCSVTQGSPANVFVIKANGLGNTTITVKDAIGNSFSLKCFVT